jgi:hypothetical protein
MATPKIFHSLNNQPLVVHKLFLFNYDLCSPSLSLSLTSPEKEVLTSVDNDMMLKLKERELVSQFSD